MNNTDKFETIFAAVFGGALVLAVALGAYAMTALPYADVVRHWWGA